MQTVKPAQGEKQRDPAGRLLSANSALEKTACQEKKY
jgi:hypothetical protein